MSLSSCVCVCTSVVILFSLEHSKHLKQDVMMELQECLRDFCLMFQGRFKDVNRKFQGCFKEV